MAFFGKKSTKIDQLLKYAQNNKNDSIYFLVKKIQSSIIKEETIKDLKKTINKSIVKTNSLLEGIYELIEDFTGGDLSVSGKHETVIELKNPEDMKYFTKLFAAIGKLDATNIKTLNGIATSITKIAKSLDKAKAAIKNVKEVVNAFTVAVVTLGTTLLLGSFIASKIKTRDILKFTGLLTLFIVSIGGVFVLLTKLMGQKSDALKGLKSFSQFVMVSAGVLILGSLFAKIIDIKESLRFTQMIMGFVIALSLPFLIFSLMSIIPGVSNPMKGAGEFSKFVIISAGILIAGSLFAGIIDCGATVKFTLIF